ncbi:hypothetical protein [Streptomyces sp. NPDC002265]|uniref:hypothetical protein n=1 Tax=Streptomyces sp. NPDC002265 TaxID=3154415 RepID=UPI00332B998A
MTERRPGRLLKMGAALALAVGGLSTVAASPALAEDSVTVQGCAHSYSYGRTEVQVDNCPGNAAASWAWISSPHLAGKDWARVDLYFKDGSSQTMWETYGGSWSQNFWNNDVDYLYMTESWVGQEQVGVWYDVS